MLMDYDKYLQHAIEVPKYYLEVDDHKGDEQTVIIDEYDLRSIQLGIAKGELNLDEVKITFTAIDEETQMPGQVRINFNADGSIENDYVPGLNILTDIKCELMRVKSKKG